MLWKGITQMVTGNSNKTLRNISARIKTEQKEAILNYLHGMVHLWCKFKKTEPFHAYDLVGKNEDDDGNYFWKDTPLYPLYEFYEQNNSKDPVKQAGIDLGWLLKEVIVKREKRTFEISKDDDYLGKVMYKWIGNER